MTFMQGEGSPILLSDFRVTHTLTPDSPMSKDQLTKRWLGSKFRMNTWMPVVVPVAELRLSSQFMSSNASFRGSSPWSNVTSGLKHVLLLQYSGCSL